nr:trehalase-like domain-containing protein [Streptomyces sp. ISL-10]
MDTSWPTYREGYLPLEDHGLIGDGRGCALVGRDGTVSFMCVPRFDSPPLFCALLDRHRGGSFRLAPDRLQDCGQHYVPDTGVLVTEMRADTGTVQVTDAFALEPGAHLEEDVPAGTGRLVRHARVIHGTVDLKMLIEPRGSAEIRRDAAGWRLSCPRQELELLLRSSRPPPAPRNT